MKDLNINETPFIVCSVERTTQDLRQNALDTINFKDDLKRCHLSFKEAQGCYKGNKEHSFIIFIDKESDYDLLKLWLKKYKQESLLYVSKHREGRLVYLQKDKEKHLGKWRVVSSCVVNSPNIDAYTLDIETNTYYIVS